MNEKRYVVSRVGNGFYIIDTKINPESLVKKYWGIGDKRDKPYKQKKQAQKI